MYYALILIYSLVLLIPFRIRSKEYDFFSPNKMFSVLLFANSLLFLIAMPFTPDISNPEVRFLLGSNYTDILCYYIVNQIIFCVVYFFTFYRVHFKKVGMKYLNIDIEPQKLLFLTALLFIISILFAYYFIQSYGGVMGVLLAMQNRAEMYEGNQLTFAVINFCIYIGGAFHIKYMSLTKVRWSQLFINILIALVVLSMQGGRSPFILYILSLGVYYNFFIKRINLFSYKLLPLYIGIVIFIASLYAFRTTGVENINGNDALESQFSVLLTGNSYVDIQALIINHFDSYDFWGGKSFRALTTMLVPRSLYPDKFPIDEGVYIHEMLFNYENVLGCKVFANSYPPSTLGIMYANFGYVGIVFGAFLLGMFHKYVYQVFLRYKSATMGYLYSFIIVKFQLTVFYIANLTYTLILLAITVFVLYMFHLNSRRCKVLNK